MLKSIVIVTIAVARLAGIDAAYEEYLDYETVASGSVSQELADFWNAPAVAGQPFLTMQPASGDEVYLRFIKAGDVEGYAPMMTYGWNATELLVKDPDSLVGRLADSPFRLVGPPKDLWPAPDAPRAMQVIGPGNELLYLTRNNEFEIRSAIDRVFIMVVAGPSMAELHGFYGDVMGLPVSDPTPFQITIVSRAQNLPADTSYPLSVARLSPRFLLELDEYPDVAGPRPVPAGSIPPGTAIVSFEVERLDALADAAWLSPPRTIHAAPYAGRRVALLTGPAGEWLELIETPAD